MDPFCYRTGSLTAVRALDKRLYMYLVTNTYVVTPHLNQLDSAVGSQ